MRETIFESKVTMVEAVEQMPCRTDFTSDEARRYGKRPLPGERENPMMETQHVERPRRGHGY
jgi:hypothetical protein